MTKKSFIDKDNPVLQFISSTDGAGADGAETSDTAETTPKTKQRGTPRAGYNGIEPKSRRIQLLLTPSLHDRVKDKAAELGFSVNEYINQILDVATKGE